MSREVMRERTLWMHVPHEDSNPRGSPPPVVAGGIRGGGHAGPGRSRHGVRHAQRRLLSIISPMIGARMTSMARPILPPGTTMLLRLDMNESCSMLSR